MSPFLKEGASERSRAAGAGAATIARGLLAANLAAQGFYGLAFLPRESFIESLDAAAVPHTTRRAYDVDAAGSVAVVAFRYGSGEYPPPDWAVRCEPDGGASLKIARFARANWYQEISRRMGSAVAGAIAQAGVQGIELPPSGRWHRLVNSRLPEKALALKSGLGWAGKNTIVIAAKTLEAMKFPDATKTPMAVAKGKEPDFSSAVLLGLLLCPVDMGSEPPKPMENRCGECSRCVEACPTRALGQRCSDAGIKAEALSGQASGYDRQRCIQHWTAIAGDPPSIVRQAMRGILYGCDICLEACPYFIPDPDATCGKGRLGSALPAACFLETTDSGLRRNLSGSALDRAWMSMEAFRRNARLAIEPMPGDKAGGDAAD